MAATGQMRALLLAAERQLALVELPVPALERPDDVLVRVCAVGICGSDCTVTSVTREGASRRS